MATNPWVSRAPARLLAAGLALLAPGARAADPPAPEPRVHVYRTVGETALEAHVLEPAEPGSGRAAIVVLHGGGWTMGDPTWAYGPARRFSNLGLVAIAGQYRLSGEEHPGVTPVDAMEDARELFRWVRAHHEELGIDPGRVAAYGWSAGAHLVAGAAAWPDTAAPDSARCSPDLMILASPAVSLHHDRWLAGLLGDAAAVAAVSPDTQVRPGMPPTLILQGRADTVTPLEGTRAFHEAMQRAGNRCELIVYDGVGHLFTPSTESDRGWPNPDPQVRERANREMERFLRELGFVE